MDVSIHLNDQPRLVTVKINDEPSDDLLSPEMDSRLVPAQFLPDASRSFRRESLYTNTALETLNFSASERT